MTKKIVQVGDKFKLGAWTWRVTQANHMEGELTAFDEDNKSVLELDLGEARHLDWLAPEIKKLTKEQGEMVKDGLDAILARFIDSITEKE